MSDKAPRWSTVPARIVETDRVFHSVGVLMAGVGLGLGLTIAVFLAVSGPLGPHASVPVWLIVLPVLFSAAGIGVAQLPEAAMAFVLRRAAHGEAGAHR